MNEITHSSSKIFISSSNTSNWVSPTTNTNLYVPFTPFILQNGDASHFIIGLESASIPLSIYAVNTSNNVLKINIHTFNIDVGNYTIAGLITYFNTYDDGIFANTLYTFSYDTVNNRITIVSTYTTAPYTTSIVIQPQTTCQKILGVVAGTYTLTYVAQNQVNLTFTSGILISINNIQTNNRDNQSTASGGTILARIPINCPLYKVLTFYNPQPFYTTVSNRVISNLNLQLLNDDYTPLELQGNPNYFITLRIDYAEKVAPVIPKTELQLAREKQLMDLEKTLIQTELKPQDLATRANKK
jgi:hypothetical protein